jgi:hypothetical protein
VTGAPDAGAHWRRRPEHQQRRDDGEVRERGMHRLEDLLAASIGDDGAHGGEDAGNQRELVGAEVRPAVGDFAEKDRQEVRRIVDRADDRVNQPVELLVRASSAIGTRALSDGGGADDGVRGARSEVRGKSSPCCARAPGDAVDGGGGEPVGAELVRGGARMRRLVSGWGPWARH